VPIALAFLLTISLPGVVVWFEIYRGGLSKRESYLVCAAAASVILCFFGRLSLTQYRQQRTFEQLKKSEREYRSLFERNLAGVFRSTPEGRYIDCNDAYARMFGYATREEVMSSNASELYANSVARVERVEQLRRQRVFSNTEGKLQRKDGSVIWVLYNVTLMEDEEGKEFVEGTIVDITERKLAEAEIAEWKNRYEAAVLASKQLIYEWAPESNRVTFGGNLESMLGYTAEEVGGRSNKWRELIHPEDAGRYQKEVERVLAGSTEPLHLEYRLRRKDDSYIVVKDDGYFAADASGRKAQMVGFISDVSEQRMLESQLRQAQKMEAVGRLAGGVAHDFNNLLTVIKGYSRMVLEDLKSEAKVRASVEHIDDAAERAASLTQHLLAFSRKQVLQPRVLDLNALMVNLDTMLRRVIGEDVVIETVAAKGLGSVKADPGQIEQVIMNLVVNARDAMPAGGTLTLETANIDLDEAYARDHDGVRPGRYVMLAVSDTGMGMDPQIQSRIFEPFFTTKELGRGTGLGLSTVYGIVKQSDGHIWVYSEPGKGTTFKIYFARVDDRAEAMAKAPKSATNVRGDQTILLVEDDQQVRELTRMILSSSGYTVLVAENRAALAKICAEYAEEIELLLTDVVMPGISGREAAGMVTARWPEVKVLYMSGYTENSIIHHGVLDTETFFLPKPFTPSALTSKVRGVLEQERQPG
jgi:PAS domain S-box-containing protein